MADPVYVNKYGRDFEFDPDTPEEVQQARIDSWMAANAADELEKTTPRTVGAAMAPGSPRRREPSFEGSPVISPEEKKADNPYSFDKIFPKVAQLALMATPLGPMSMLPDMRKRLGNIDTYRTLAQGMVPGAVADEGVAGIRSLLGEDYDTALEGERAGLKRYEEEHGPGEAALTTMIGAIPTIAATMGAGTALQIPRLAPALARHPWLASVLTGGATGAVQGFGAGEGGAEARATNAAGMAGLGALLGPAAVTVGKGAERLGRLFNKDSAVAQYLRSRIGTEMGEDLQTRGVPRAPGGAPGVDTMDPSFPTQVGQLLRKRDREARALGVDPMLADQLPGTTEAAVLKSGPETQGLAERLWRRQFDFRNPTLGRKTGQTARVGDAFEEHFGPNTFKGEYDDLIKARRNNAEPLFEVAHGNNVRGPQIEEALNNPLIRDAWPDAMKFAEAAGHPVPNQISRNVSSYNTGFLHELKQALDVKIAANTSDVTGRMNAKGQKYTMAKNKLNDAIEEANPDYKIAMKQYGDDSGRIKALHKGRDEIFLSEDKGGMSAQQIKDYLANPKISDAEKELFRTGAARALRAKVLEPTGKAYTHNWADFINKPGYVERMEALVDPRATGEFSAAGWKKFQNRLQTEAKNFANFQRATGNSRTAGRQELVKEIESAVPGESIPNAYSARSAVIKSILDHIRGSPNVVRSGTVSNDIARLLNTKTSREASTNTAEIERLLRGDMGRTNRFDTASILGPHSLAYGWPTRTSGRDR